MQAVHEFGHVVAARLTGGTVVKVILHPLAISRTDVRPNPKPLIEVWGGPIVGSLLPIALWAACAAARIRFAYLVRFFAGFCLIANGAYIGFGSFGRIGDCGEMLRYGTPIWAPWLFGALAMPAGLWLWNDMTKNFRRDSGFQPATAIETIVVDLLLLLTVAAEFLLSASG